jgi:UPF0755 protein
MHIRKNISILILLLLFIIGSFFYINNKMYFSKGSLTDLKNISIENGDNALVVGEKLYNANIISNKYLFTFYLWKIGKLHSIIAGVYEFPRGMQIPEAVLIVTGGEVVPMRIKVTFPEGWTMKDYAERLTANGLAGNDFLTIAVNPTQSIVNKYSFLKELPIGSSLEGYLFPDTYYFSKQASAEDIIGKMLDNYSVKVFDMIKSDLISQKKQLFEIMTMGSIIEGEVRNNDDRKIVSGLFWNRISIGMPLQSDATLEYALGTKKTQHSIAETKINSPYNSYQNKGLPPGPVSNPGIASILAALNPSPTEFVYFLSDPKTGQTIFAKTFEQHIANKSKYGL